MRIIHTADWHIGQTLSGFGREFEHRTVLDELVTLVSNQKADALIIAGDIFDHHNPSGEAQRLFYETLVRLKNRRPKMTIIVTAGNHDAAGRLEAPRALLEGMDVHIIGNVRRHKGRIDGTRHLIPLKNEHEEVAAHVLAVSFPTAACLPPISNLEVKDGVSQVIEATRKLYDELMQATKASSSHLPLIITGHLHVAGGIESEGSERRILVGGQHAVPPDIFPKEAAYVALGHLHKAQAVGRETIRYCGSLLPLSATELNYKHGVTLLTLEGHKATTQHMELKRPVPFLRLPEQGELQLDDLDDHLKALDLPKDLPTHLQPFLQVQLSRQGLAAGFRAQVDRISEAYPVRLVDTRVAPRPDRDTDERAQEPLIRLVELKPEDLFNQAFEQEHGFKPTSEHRQAFHLAASQAED